MCAFNAEMIDPAILPGIEQPSQETGLGVQRGDVRALVPVAENTCQRQIIQNGKAAMFATDNVVDLVRKASISLVDETVLATPTRAGNYIRP